MKNVIFDWSGTLVDDLPPVLEATNRIFAHYRREAMDREEFRRTFKLPFAEFYDDVLPGVLMDDLDQLYMEFFAGSEAKVSILPQAVEFLDYCQSVGKRIFLLSSIHQDHFDEQSAELGLGHYFEVAYAQVLDKKQKIHEILEVHRLDPSETMFVGDMVHDVETAKHGGVFSVATLTGYDPPDRLAAAEPDLTVSDLADLRKFLEMPV
ncbi:MAG: HAD family hydrolase [Verrucomicrobiales bacterium]